MSPLSREINEAGEKLGARLTAGEEALRRIGKRRAQSIRNNTKRSLWQELFRVLFITLCILVDGLLPFEFVVKERTPIGFALTAASLAVLVASQILAYSRIWGKNGCWRIKA